MDETIETRFDRRSRHVAMLHNHWETLANAVWGGFQKRGRCLVRVKEADLLGESLDRFMIEHPHENEIDGTPIMIAIESYKPFTEILVIIEQDDGHEAVYVIESQEEEFPPSEY
jgi:hypothetical protein